MNDIMRTEAAAMAASRTDNAATETDSCVRCGHPRYSHVEPFSSGCVQKNPRCYCGGFVESEDPS